MSSSEEGVMPSPRRLQRVVSFEETDLLSNRTTAGMVELDDMAPRSFIAPNYNFDSPPPSTGPDSKEAVFAFLPPPPEFEVDHVSLEDGPAKVKSLIEENHKVAAAKLALRLGEEFKQLYLNEGKGDAAGQSKSREDRDREEDGKDEKKEKKKGQKAGTKQAPAGSWNETKAMDMFSTALSLLLSIHGESHADTARTLVSLGDVFERQGDYARAVNYYNRALTTQEKLLGRNDETTTNTAIKVAAIQSLQSEYYSKALEMYEQALQVKLEAFGEVHPSTAMTLINMGAVYKQQGDCTRALDFFVRALTIRVKCLGEKDADTATAVNNVAEVYRLEGDYALSLKYYEWALVIRREAFGQEHSQTADTLYNIALLHKHMRNYGASRKHFEEVAEMLVKMHGEAHPETQDAANQAKRMARLQAQAEGSSC